MSNHFTYEIDERKLRVKLKDLEYPLNEELWKKFEESVASQNKQNNSDFLKNVQIPISRSIVLPLVFAGVVLLFSFLLYKFIDIKNEDVKPNTSVTQETIVTPAATNTQSVDISPQSKNAVNSVPKVEPKVSNANGTLQVNSPSTTSVNASISRTPTTPITRQQDTQIVTNKKETKPVNTTSATLNTNNTSSLKPDSSVKKKTEKRRDANDILETEITPDTRPTINLDERETGGRPNK